jgi:hypothetical protein
MLGISSVILFATALRRNLGKGFPSKRKMSRGNGE